MNKSLKQTRVILIGGSYNVGKSTLAQYQTAKLGWNYRSTDKLARHPGRPWIKPKDKAIREYVAQHYKTLSTEALFLDVLSHYEKNVLPQVEAIVRSHAVDLSRKCLVIEGSALYPSLVANLVRENGVKAIWLTASDQFFRNRIKGESNFESVSEDEKHLIEKFIGRTLLYNKHMREEIERLEFICIDVESTSTVDELASKCMELISENV
ncbi:MAG: 2-phosphoglycerate kinase [Rivularia sp. (in: cyanobacteria)]